MNIKFPVTITFDTGAEEKCNSIKEIQEEILNAHSEQSFPDSITDSNGKELGVHWSVQIVEL
jgi:hypothetical protein